MRLLVCGLLLALTLASVSSAELLVTANPLGKGKLGVEAVYLNDSNVTGVSAYGAGTLGAYLGYGATDTLDLFLSYGVATATGLPGSITDSITGLGLTAKYLVAAEGKDMPVSVALGLGYKLLTDNSDTSSIPGGSKTTTGGGQLRFGVGASKMMVPFIPYAGINYKSTSYNGSTFGTQIDATLGTAIAWSQQGAVYLEYTLQSMTPNGGSNFTSGQIGAAVGYLI